MTRYNVHIYREMRLRFDGIEACTPQEAAEQAKDLSLKVADDFDECDGETFAALVDLQSDEEFGQSQTIDFEGERIQKAATKLVEALARVLPYARAEAEGLEGYRGEDEVADQQADDAWAAVNQADAVLAEMTNNATASQPIVIEVRGGVVMDVQNVPPGYQYEIKDYDDLEAADEATKGAA